MQTYDGFTNEFVLHAIDELDVVEMILDRYKKGDSSPEKLHHNEGCLIILKPGPWEPKYGRTVPTQAFVDEVVAAIIMFGGDETFFHAALGKAHLSFVQGEDSDEVVLSAVKLQPGACRWGGSYITDSGLIVAYSGGTQEQDVNASMDIAEKLENFANEAYVETVDEDMTIAFIGFPERSMPDMPLLPDTTIIAS